MAVKSKEYKDYTKPELEDKLRQLEEELFGLKFQLKTTSLDKPHKIKMIRKNIARIKTFMRQSRLQEEKAPEKKKA